MTGDKDSDDETPASGLERTRAELEVAIRTSHEEGATLSDLVDASGLSEAEVRAILDET